MWCLMLLLPLKSRKWLPLACTTISQKINWMEWDLWDWVFMSLAKRQMQSKYFPIHNVSCISLQLATPTAPFIPWTYSRRHIEYAFGSCSIAYFPWNLEKFLACLWFNLFSGKNSNNSNNGNNSNNNNTNNKGILFLKLLNNAMSIYVYLH